MTEQADFVVVGLGAMGSAVLYQLAKRGADVIGVDRFAPPHQMGSSHGETRITRQAVGEGGAYAPLVLSSHRIWRELEGDTGERLLSDCGVLVMGPGTGSTSHHGKPDFVARSIEVARGFGIVHEVLDGAEVGRRFPQFLGLAGNEKAYYEPDGGYVFPERCIKAQLMRAAQLGAHLTVNRQVLHWYELDDLTAYGPNAPAFIWMHGATDVDYFYGFPPLPGDHRVKVATEQYETRTTADTINREVDPVESEAMYRKHVQGRLASAKPRVAHAAACLYTVTPDRGFIIDRHPRHDRVFVISACSGHGFKHSAGIGDVVAERLTEGHNRVDLTAFSIARFA